MEYKLEPGNIYDFILKESGKKERSVKAIFTGKIYSKRRIYSLNLLFRNYRKRPNARCFDDYKVKDKKVVVNYSKNLKLNPLEKEFAEQILSKKNL